MFDIQKIYDTLEDINYMKGHKMTKWNEFEESRIADIKSDIKIALEDIEIEQTLIQQYQEQIVNIQLLIEKSRKKIAKYEENIEELEGAL